MSLVRESETHKRRRSLNRAVGIVLVSFVALVFALTVVKVTSGDLQFQPAGLSDG